MNGEYILSPTPNGDDTQHKYPTHFKDYPRGVEYFDVYSPPITSLYSQVFWTGLPAVPLPADIVSRYHGKGMAVVGFEVDQVRKTPKGDVSVPINVAYNHHFESNMVGANARLEKIQFTGPDDARLLKLQAEMGHGLPSQSEHWVVRDLNPDGAIPSHQSFGGANGGEYRKSFHGYPPGYAQVIESPREFQMTPMQIDTWNRDKMSLDGPTKFVPGPLPHNSLAPTVNPQYSGLLECPVTTRIRKDVKANYDTVTENTCPSSISTASECFDAAPKLLGSSGFTTFNNTYITDATLPAGCLAASDADARVVHVMFNRVQADAAAQCGDGVQALSGQTQSLVNVKVDVDAKADLVTITLAGPSAVWFGVGFNASAMKGAPWTIIVEGDGKVSERKLQDQSPGTLLKSTLKVVSTSVTNGTRTVVLTRPVKGDSSDYFSFGLNGLAQLPIINAVGSKPTLSFHKDKSPSSLSLLPVGGGVTCICASAPAPFGQGQGTLNYVQTAQAADVGRGTIHFGNRCAPEPRTDMLAQKNPTCDVRTYTGGQTACHHMFSLLDADQEIPWVDQPLVYHQKFRFWVQPYNASYHTNLKRTTWGIASPVEYDVPKCEEGMDGCTKAEYGWIHTIRGTYGGGGHLVAAHFHCHAPTCLSMQMYRCDKSVKVCNATTGDLICREDPVYGGTGKIDNVTFDEPGYILQPPCLWGSAEFGLEPPIDTSGYTLHTVKTSNATYGHHGEMAWQQMYFY